MHHARAFAQHIHRAHARAAQPQNVGVQNGQRRAAQVAGGDLLDEARHVDVGGAGRRAGRVEAVEAAVGFGQRGLRIERRMQLRKLLQVPRNRQRAGSAHACDACTARLLSSSSMNWSTSARPMFMGGEMRSTLPYIPPLPISRRFSRAASSAMRGRGRGGRLRAAVLHQLDGLHQAHAAHVADDLVLLLQLFQAAAQVRAGLGAVGQQVLLFDEIDDGLGGGGGHGVAAESGDGQAL